MIAPSEFQRYLQSILNVSREDIQREVRDRYIPTLAELPLQVQTCASSKADSQEQQQEKREQFAVLEGLRKYAPEHVLLVGKPGSGKSTSLRRLFWEEAGRCLEAIEQGNSEIPPIPILIELRSLCGSLLSAIQEKLEWWLDLDEKTLKALLRDRRLLVLLDGCLQYLVQEGRRQKAGCRRKESLYSKLFNLFQLDSYFRHAALDCASWLGDRKFTKFPDKW